MQIFSSEVETYIELFQIWSSNFFRNLLFSFFFWKQIQIIYLVETNYLQYLTIASWLYLDVQTSLYFTGIDIQ